MPGDEVSVFLLCENRLLREALLRILGKRVGLVIVGASGCSRDATAGCGRLPAAGHFA